uniref:SET domain-containing protein n=1 Tax=Chromera velia CCMP2878 TaxID=1169474 RepID=A0A0G4H124_9ALVE|eukprot:Cvel_5534.t1-p1 / transcript=Cvel_5534.t1 / gene=Cvel_5534 / organism=Chromera_velia_CCMP2878 / gene_product=hypothetical protein / transcript_product=hypothetical protein / location=Cvel_scaffold259:63377-68144(+) / protein_length=234 / sequence_SO=supercontig / SO=protein_coding / is_pseudo=false
MSSEGEEEGDRQERKGSCTKEYEEALKAYVRDRRHDMTKNINVNRLPGSYRLETTARDERADQRSAENPGEFLVRRWVEPKILHGKVVAVIGDGVSVRKSKLGKDAGNGLFAAHDFEKHDSITEYVGHIIDQKTADQLREEGKDSHIMTVVRGWQALDGLKDIMPGTGGGQFANDGTRKINGKSPGINAKREVIFDNEIGDYRVYLKATKRIPKRQEILISYDKHYWAIREEAQ